MCDVALIKTVPFNVMESEPPSAMNGISSTIIAYLESQNSPEYLGGYLRKYHGIEMNSNQEKLLTMMASGFGLKERNGNAANPEIMKFFYETGHVDVESDEVSWCSSYLAWCCQMIGLERSYNLLAKSWLEVGEIVKKPQMGDVVVFWREKPNSWQGHVGVYIGENIQTQQIYCLGGNQDGKVCIRPYPKKQVVGYRRLGKQKFD